MLNQRDTKQVFWMKGGKKNAGSGNHFLAGVYIQSWCCSVDGVQTQAGVMGIRTPWPDTPGTELVTDEDLMLFLFLFFSSTYSLFLNRNCISPQWLISPPAYPCNTGWIEGYSMQISELSKTETRSARLLLNLSALHAAVQA